MGVKSAERKARNEQIRNAFSRALTLEAGPFRLKGRGYEPRTTLKSHIARLLNDLELPYASVSQGPSVRYYYPLRIVTRAAQIMGVDAAEFTSTINCASGHEKEQSDDEERAPRLFC
jgi:hypothetical protein